MPDQKATCYLLLSIAILYLCAISLCLLSVIWGVAFYYVAVKVLCCLCEDFCFLVLLCLVLCLVILLYYSNCIILIVLLCFLLSDICFILFSVILSGTKKIKAKRIMCVILIAFLY